MNQHRPFNKKNLVDHGLDFSKLKLEPLRINKRTLKIRGRYNNTKFSGIVADNYSEIMIAIEPCKKSDGSDPDFIESLSKLAGYDPIVEYLRNGCGVYEWRNRGVDRRIESLKRLVGSGNIDSLIDRREVIHY
jgi:hypothetical protein